MKKLSIIIPIYNLEKYLKQCIESIIAQELHDIEVILVDNASTDQSAEICDFYSNRYKDIKVVHLTQNILPAGARNEGLNIATGEFVHFCDGDDFYLENELNNIFCFDKEIDVIVGQFECIPEKGAYVTQDVQLDELIINNCEAQQISDYLLSFPALLCTPWRLIVRRQFLIEHNLYFPKGVHSEDEEWFPKVICLAKKFKLLKQPFYCYRPRAVGSVTSEKSFINTKSHLIVAVHLLKFYFEQNFNDSRDNLILSRVRFLMGLFSTRCDTLTEQQIIELNYIFINEDLNFYQSIKSFHPLFDLFIKHGVYEAINIYKLQIIESTTRLVEDKYNKQIYLMPTGYNGEATSRILRHANYSIKGFLDNSQSKKGILIDGVLVSLPEILENFKEAEKEEVFIIICNQQSRIISILREQLSDLGISDEQIVEKVY